jgi:hypothetical protein
VTVMARSADAIAQFPAGTAPPELPNSLPEASRPQKSEGPSPVSLCRGTCQSMSMSSTGDLDLNSCVLTSPEKMQWVAKRRRRCPLYVWTQVERMREVRGWFDAQCLVGSRLRGDCARLISIHRSELQRVIYPPSNNRHNGAAIEALANGPELEISN